MQPAFEMSYAQSPAHTVIAQTELMCTIEPPPAASRCGIEILVWLVRRGSEASSSRCRTWLSGISARIAFGVIHGIIPVILFTMNAVRNIRPVYLRSARAMRLTPAQTALTILLPAALPEIVSGFRRMDYGEKSARIQPLPCPSRWASSVWCRSIRSCTLPWSAPFSTNRNAEPRAQGETL